MSRTTARRRPRRIMSRAAIPGRATIALRTDAEVARLKAAAQVVVRVHEALAPGIVAGVTTRELDRLAAEVIAAAGGRASFLGHHGFRRSICTSVNDEIIHGIPGGRVLRDGDILSVDVGVELDGYHGDAAWSYPVGQVAVAARQLLDGTEAALAAAVDAARAGAMLADIGRAVEAVAASAGLGVVADYGGHGLGQTMWEEPHVPNIASHAELIRLRPGMVLAIEPMLTLGGAAYRVDADGWTVRTVDGSLSAHMEHDIVIQRDGPPKVLTAGLENVVYSRFARM